MTMTADASRQKVQPNDNKLHETFISLLSTIAGCLRRQLSLCSKVAMARSKQNKSQTKKVDGKYRQETREERRLRLKQQEEAREVSTTHIAWVIDLKHLVFANMLNILVFLFSNASNFCHMLEGQCWCS